MEDSSTEDASGEDTSGGEQGNVVAGSSDYGTACGAERVSGRSRVGLLRGEERPQMRDANGTCAALKIRQNWYLGWHHVASVVSKQRRTSERGKTGIHLMGLCRRRNSVNTTVCSASKVDGSLLGGSSISAPPSWSPWNISV